MPSTRLGRDAEKYLAQKKSANEAPRKPSRIARIGRAFVVLMVAGFSMMTLLTAGTAKAGIWDFKDQLVAQVMNVCNPNEIPMTTDTTSWIDSALGSAGEDRPQAEGENKDGNIWSTYNPMVLGEGGSYVPGSGNIGDMDPDEFTGTDPGQATIGWINFMRADNDGGWVYTDNYSDRGKVDPADAGWMEKFSGEGYEGSNAQWAANPGSAKAAYYNGPTVALQTAYADAPSWVIHPTYTRYGFESLDWTTYGASCYSPTTVLQGIPSFLYWLLVQIPTLMTFGMLRITLGGELAGVFYNIVYGLTSIFGTFIKPWAGVIGIFIGLPFVWTKSKGSVQKLIGSALWVAAMIFAIGYISDSKNARNFTEFSQGLVVKVSGTMACTISQQAMGEDEFAFGSANDIAKDQQTPVYDSNGKITGWETMENARERVKTAAEENGISEDEVTSLTMDDLRGVKGNTTTACGSYLDGIYNSFWLGIPLQVWAEGEVGAGQAARDRVSESNGRIGWYQAILNSMYVNPNDETGRAQIIATSRWNDANYTKTKNGKPTQWTQDGKTSGDSGDQDRGDKVTPLDADKTATPWKTIPFLLNVKFMCKDDNTGNTSDSKWGEGDMADYGANKWLYDGTCITAGDAGMIASVTGYNFVDRIGLSIVGGWLSGIVALFTIGICVYIGYQKFLWGWMLLFAPILLGIAAFPDAKRRDFAKKYFEWCLSNIIKQIVAVVVLVVTVTALGKIVFPQAVAIGDASFYLPWMMKPWIALMFMLSAVLFALPLRKIMVGAVKGDSSVVNKVAEMPADAAKAAAVVAAAAAITAGTAGTGTGAAGALLSGAGRMAQGAAMRKGGMTGSLASLASKPLSQKGESLMAKGEQAKQAKKASMANMPAKQKKLGTAAMSKKAALAANANAQKNGQTLPYATDAKGNLTKSAQKQAKKDFVGAQKGQFWKSPEFSAMTRNESLNGEKLEGIKDGMKGDYLDASGNLKERALDMDAKKELATMNAGTLDRQKSIGQELLAGDKAKPIDQRRYLGADGSLSAEGQRKLFADIRGADENGVQLANSATASALLADNAEHYNQFSTAEDPNGNYRQALSDANLVNFGTDGAIGSTPVHKGMEAGLDIQPIKGTQAYMSASAPVIGGDLNREEGAALVQDIGSSMPNLSAEANTSLTSYAETLSNSEATPTQIADAHREALVSVQESGNLSGATNTVQSQIIAPVAEQGMSITPDAVTQISHSLPEDNVGLRNSLDSYSSALAEHGSDSNEAHVAFDNVRHAVTAEDAVTYSNFSQSLPTPETVRYESPVTPAVAPAPQAPATPTDPAPVAPTPESSAPQAPPVAPVSTPAPEAPRVDSSPPEAPRPEAPRVDSTPPPPPEAPRPEAPRPEAPRVDSTPPPPEAPRPEAPRVDSSPSPAPAPPRDPHVSGVGMGGFFAGSGRSEERPEERPEDAPQMPPAEEEVQGEEKFAAFNRDEHRMYDSIDEEKKAQRLAELKSEGDRLQAKIRQQQGLLKKRSAEARNGNKDASDLAERITSRIEQLREELARVANEIQNLMR